MARNLPSAAILVSHHNVAYTQALTRRMRQAIKVEDPSLAYLPSRPSIPFPSLSLQDQVFPEWVRGYLQTMFPRGDVPLWVREAMQAAGIDLTGVATAEPAAAETVVEERVE